MTIERIVSGGQTGADRAALDFAIDHGIPHGGWCPKGRRAEDGIIDETYQLAETPDRDYAKRTERNVIDSCVTVIFSLEPELTGGSKLTQGLARKHGRPCLHLARAAQSESAAAQKLDEFLAETRARVLNVAGPRASHEPEIGDFVRAVLAQSASKP